jgi:hypothetical protein
MAQEVLAEMKSATVTNASRRQARIGAPELPPQAEMVLTASAGEKSVRKKSAKRKGRHALALQKSAGDKSKSNRLVCRYCGSEDLAPSFIKRRDRRCRKCFSKRYGSAARASKAKLKK